MDTRNYIDPRMYSPVWVLAWFASSICESYMDEMSATDEDKTMSEKFNTAGNYDTAKIWLRLSKECRGNILRKYNCNDQDVRSVAFSLVSLGDLNKDHINTLLAKHFPHLSDKKFPNHYFVEKYWEKPMCSWVFGMDMYCQKKWIMLINENGKDTVSVF